MELAFQGERQMTKETNNKVRTIASPMEEIRKDSRCSWESGRVERFPPPLVTALDWKKFFQGVFFWWEEESQPGKVPGDKHSRHRDP